MLYSTQKKAKIPFFKCVLYSTYVLYSNYLVYSAPPSNFYSTKVVDFFCGEKRGARKSTSAGFRIFLRLSKSRKLQVAKFTIFSGGGEGGFLKIGRMSSVESKKEASRSKKKIKQMAPQAKKKFRVQCKNLAFYSTESHIESFFAEQKRKNGAAGKKN